MRIDGIVHVIDDDEAVRDSLAFLLQSAKLPVETYEMRRRLPEVPADRWRLHHHRHANARDERHRPAQAAAGDGKDTCR